MPSVSISCARPLPCRDRSLPGERDPWYAELAGRRVRGRTGSAATLAIRCGTVTLMEPTAVTNEGPPLIDVGTTKPVSREHIVCTPDTCGGKPRIAGSRIQVKHLAIMHERQGMSPEEIVSEFPHITLADIHAALAYYHDHREAINAEIAADGAWYEEQREKQPSKLQAELKARKAAHAENDPLPPG